MSWDIQLSHRAAKTSYLAPIELRFPRATQSETSVFHQGIRIDLRVSCSRFASMLALGSVAISGKRSDAYEAGREVYIDECFRGEFYPFFGTLRLLSVVSASSVSGYVLLGRLSARQAWRVSLCQGYRSDNEI